MKLEVNYRILRLLLILFIMLITSIFIIKFFGRGESIHKFLFKNTITVQSEEEFNYNILNIYGDVHIRGKTTGNISTIGSDVYIDGEVKGNIICLFGRIHKGEKAKVYGKELEVSKEKRDKFIENSIFHINQFLYIIIGIIICESLYFTDSKQRLRVANKLSSSLSEKFKYGYIIGISEVLILLVLIFSFLGIQFSPAIGLIPLISLVGFIMYIIGFISIIIYIGKKINLNLSIQIPYPVYISLFIIIYSFIRNIPYLGIIIEAFLVIPLSMGMIYVEYFHNCLNRLNSSFYEKTR
ncbi:hypothetical protein G8S49_06680 [Clostridium botulinum C]|uniref:Polymer-forming cytoskeletal protein n=2 Tax=Clostridium botulinum TaxID=1491 RepID=A0A9Q4XSB2_CLOBO|nr:polymer-forming cytoskeletal protein [Clostridium botulinum]MCD3194926.1 hypothetical protein [Clostridium botulinum C]MCD3201428.1 hypothetical protein [Clostridium botulinum C]MCD3206908.1 hypothetical protein [Clostridium botulinum C]MCD3208331.1 hypothetical protein [Clostridium botulinum C]MCD3225861.1 hypothetical protein [Clostridium botulinum C]